MPKPINISASRGASILGLSKWKTPVQTWLEIMEAREPGFCAKNKYELPVFEEHAALRWGSAFESAIIELAERKQNSSIINREAFCFATKNRNNGKTFEKNSIFHYLTTHIDGLYRELSAIYSPILHEGKTTSYFYFNDNFGEPGTDRVPVEYQIQCQHQMICTGAEKVILSVLVFPRRVEEWEEMGWIIDQDTETKLWWMYKEEEPIVKNPKFWAEILDQMGYFHQYTITAHPELQKRMIAHYTEFWNENVLKAIPPVPQTYDDIKALCTEPVGTILTELDYVCVDCNYGTKENINKCPKCGSEKIGCIDTIANLMAEYRNIKSEIGGTGPLAKRADQIKVAVLDYMKDAGVVADDESSDKWILRDNAGNKLASYGRDKNGKIIFR